MPAVILHHGLLGGGMRIGRLKWGSFRHINTFIAASGYPVFVSAVHPTASVQRRAGELQKWILSLLPQLRGEPIILVAHSMGGLDARYLLAKSDLSRHIAALVTVCTPHHGSPLADWVLEHFGRSFKALSWAEKFGLEIGAVPDLTCERCAIFNQQIPNVPGVRYYSVGASRPFRDMPAFAKFSHAIISKSDGPNDGLVSVRSAKWGTYLGTWRADHWQSVNRRYSWRKRHRPVNIAQNYLSAVEIAAKNLNPR